MLTCMRPRVVSLFEASLTGHTTTAFNAALGTEKTAGNTTASAAVQTAGVDAYRIADHLECGLGDVLSALMPAKVTAKVKRQMRREMRKPVDMKVRAYSQNLIRINMDDIPVLPPFVPHQELSSDELLDILLHGTPRSWQNEMDRQGFDPITKGYFATIDFMENLEGLEQKQEVSSPSKDKKASTKSKDKSSDGTKKKTTHFCQLHGPNWTHDTSECRGIKNNEKKGTYSNKTWTRKSEESTSKSKKDLAAFLAKSVKDQVKAGVKKELAALGKKRKTKSDNEDQECALVKMF